MLEILLLVSIFNTALTVFLLRSYLRDVHVLKSYRFNRTDRPFVLRSLRHSKVTSKPKHVQQPDYTERLTVSSREPGTSAIISYFHKKGDGSGMGENVFCAMHFKNSGIFDGKYIPADTYLILDNSEVLPATDFEAQFEQSKIALVCPRIPTTPAKKTVIISETLSEEEVQDLAAEYELSNPG